jgi:hypothetical protein
MVLMMGFTKYTLVMGTQEILEKFQNGMAKLDFRGGRRTVVLI